MQRQLWLTLIAVFLLAGCGTLPQPDTPSPSATVDSDDQDETTPQPTEEPAPSLNIATFSGPQIASIVDLRADAFSEQSSYAVKVTTLSFNDLYQAASNPGSSYDAYILPSQWTADLAAPGLIANLTEWVEGDTALNWDEIAPHYRNHSAQYDGQIYNIPFDSDVLMLYYRTDIFQRSGVQPPRTWEEYLRVARVLNRQDMNRDGFADDYGSCIGKASGEQAYWWLYAIAAPYLQTEGTSQGIFFNTDDMTPLTQNRGFTRALEIYLESARYGPTDELNIGVRDTRALFVSGRCAMTIDFAELGLLASDPERSIVDDVTGTMLMPGSAEVVDFETGDLVGCNDETCPLAVEGINYAPYAAFGGWAGVVSTSAAEDAQAEAYAFLSYMSQQSSDDILESGFNPYRLTDVENPDVWIDAGFNEETAQSYNQTLELTLSNENIVLDLRVPSREQYQIAALDQALTDMFRDNVTPAATSEALFERFERITDNTGRDILLEVYQATLNQ